MKYFGLVIGTLLLGAPVVARAQGVSSDSAKQDSAAPAGTTLASLVGTWKGGPSDSAWTVTAGKDSSMTLTVRPDSTYTWTGLPSSICMSKPGLKLKRLSSTNISWCGGPGHNFKLDGKKLFLSTKQATQGKRSYYVFTQVDTPPK